MCENLDKKADEGTLRKEKKQAQDILDECVAKSLKRLDSTKKDCQDFYGDFKKAVEYLSEGTNTVILDDLGMPSVMVKVDKMKTSDLINTKSDETHPAFFAGGRELDSVYVSKYLNIVRNGRAYSLPMQDPAAYMTLEDAFTYCSNKGEGWGITPFSIRAAIALWTKKNGTIPNGNNSAGCDYFSWDERGVQTQEGRVLTGSGPVSWSHNGKSDGIYDMNGNLNEWDAGLRLVDGEIQIIPGVDSMLSTNDEVDSLWRAVMPDGSIAAPGTKGTLRYGGRNGSIILTDAKTEADEKYNCAFQDMRAEEGLYVPEILKALMLFPETEMPEYGTGWRWVATKGECYPLCGGASAAIDHAGIFFVGMTYPKEHKYLHSGFRSAYIDLKQ